MTPSNPTRYLIGLALALALVASACGSDESSSDTTADSATAQTDATTADVSEEPTASGDVATVGLDPTAFIDGALVDEVVTTDCVLSGGTETSCYVLTVAGFPANRDAIGPWCPETTSDGAAGIWFDGNAVYDIDGQFILDLADIYDDPTWQVYDEDGNVLSTDTSEAFNELVTGAPQDDADAGPVNLCVYGEIEWVEGGEPIPSTVEIPVAPVMADGPTNVGGNLGVTLDGVVIANSAPIELILGNYTVGAFDPCGGHVNPQEGYHMHATTGCSDADTAVGDGETAMFGYALDGYPIHAPYDESVEPEAGLDECNGHETDDLGYHYHANQPEENAVLTCLHGETSQTGGTGGRPPGDGAGPPPGDDA